MQTLASVAHLLLKGPGLEDRGETPSCLLRLLLAQAAASRVPGLLCPHGPQGRVAWIQLLTLCASQPPLCCPVSKASCKEGCKSHLDAFPRAFLNCFFLLILRLAKKQNFHRWEMLMFACGFAAGLRQEAEGVGFLPK